MHQATGYCDYCQRDTAISRPSTNHVLHLFLSVLTFGMWIPIWSLAAAGNMLDWRCSCCGHPTPRNLAN